MFPAAFGRTGLVHRNLEARFQYSVVTKREGKSKESFDRIDDGTPKESGLTGKRNESLGDISNSVSTSSLSDGGDNGDGSG